MTEPKRPICPCCKREIDPTVCWCGTEEKFHMQWDNHQFIPMGCKCYKHKEAK